MCDSTVPQSRPDDASSGIPPQVAASASSVGAAIPPAERLIEARQKFWKTHQRLDARSMDRTVLAYCTIEKALASRRCNVGPVLERVLKGVDGHLFIGLVKAIREMLKVGQRHLALDLLGDGSLYDGLDD